MPDQGLQRDSATQPQPDTAGLKPTARRPAAHLSTQIIESVQTILTGLMLAFMFRTFFVEPFIIPTGSMAQSLLGRHGAMVCRDCGWEFDYGPASGQTDRRGRFEPPARTFCPNCHKRSELAEDDIIVEGGDRILVHKWPYMVGGPLGPHRWDVIVFRDPSNPAQNYIKRLVGLPGETIEIVDGDVFIKTDGTDEFRVARKTSAAQSALWFVVFDQDFLPTGADREGRHPVWVAEDAPNPDSGGWSGLATRSISCIAKGATPQFLNFDPPGALEYLQDVYAYNHGTGGNYVGDVRIVAETALTDGNGSLRWEIVRDGQLFAARFGRDGTIALLTRPDVHDSEEIELASTRIKPFDQRRPHVLELGHLDYRVYIKVDGHPLLATNDRQYAPRLDELRGTRRLSPLRLRMVARDISLTLRGLRVDRDVYYAYSAANTRRAFAENPFHLRPGEYFVLGDNSPNSHDSREWYRVGPHLRAGLACDDYQIGTVRADQIVGRAFFVYLPGLLPVGSDPGWRMPDVGRMRFIR